VGACGFGVGAAGAGLLSFLPQKNVLFVTFVSALMYI
jgi:hypothetical protein